MDNITTGITAILVAGQTALIEAIVFVNKYLISETVTRRNAGINILLTTCAVLAVTLSICNAVLDLNKTDKILVSVALVTQASIVAVAQLKNLEKIGTTALSPATTNVVNDEINEQVQLPQT